MTELILLTDAVTVFWMGKWLGDGKCSEFIACVTKVTQHPIIKVYS